MIFTGSTARLTSASKQMPMSGPAYMDASVVTPRLTANQHTGNGRDHLCMVERHDEHIIFPSWCSRDYSLSHVIQHMNYTQVPNFDIHDLRVLVENKSQQVTCLTHPTPNLFFDLIKFLKRSMFFIEWSPDFLQFCALEQRPVLHYILKNDLIEMKRLSTTRYSSFHST